MPDLRDGAAELEPPWAGIGGGRLREGGHDDGHARRDALEDAGGVERDQHRGLANERRRGPAGHDLDVRWKPRRQALGDRALAAELDLDDEPPLGRGLGRGQERGLGPLGETFPARGGRGRRHGRPRPRGGVDGQQHHRSIGRRAGARPSQVVELVDARAADHADARRRYDPAGDLRGLFVVVVDGDRTTAERSDPLAVRAGERLALGGGADRLLVQCDEGQPDRLARGSELALGVVGHVGRHDQCHARPPHVAQHHRRHQVPVGLLGGDDG
ncbi:MAG: hypothetical protein ACO3IB_10870, partial [Phycisphaerales bacterium]